MKPVSRSIDRIEAIFDDPNSVANAGLILVGTLIFKLGLEALINEWVHLDRTRDCCVVCVSVVVNG